MTKRLASLCAVALSIAGLQAQAVEYIQFDGPMAAFEAVCLSAPDQQGAALAPEMQKLMRDEIESWAENTGSDPAMITDAYAFYADSVGMLLVQDEVPETCTLTWVDEKGATAFAALWNDFVQQPDNGFRTERPADVKNPKRVGGFATKPHDGNFVQITAQRYAFGDVGLAMLLSAYVGDTPASCTLWPEECE